MQSNYRILVVEDDNNSRASLKMMLNEIGFNNLFEAEDGDEAVDIMNKEIMNMDLVISDWNMPNLSGLEFLQKLRLSNPTLPFIMITGRSDANSLQEALTAGVSGYIRKPFSLAELESKLKFMQKLQAL